MENKEKKTRVRSPNYPSITLERGLELTEIIRKNQNRYLVPLEVIAKDWGLSAKSGYMYQQIAALTSYGLVDVEVGKDIRKVKISDLAFTILVDNRPESLERQASIREAALKPAIFKKIYDAYSSGLPADYTLEFDLITKYKFNTTSVKEFIDILKKTFYFADVYKSGILAQEKTIIKETEMPIPDKEPIKEPIDSAKDFLFSGPPKTPKIIEIPMPLSLTESVKIQATYPLSEKAWQQMLNILNAYKPSLVPLEDKGEDDKKEN